MDLAIARLRPRQIVPNKNIRSVVRQNIGFARQKLSQ
jgi:hypothetical protein